MALAMGSVSPCALLDTAPFVVLFSLLLLCFLFCYICGCRFVALDLLFLVLTIQAVKRRCSLLVHCSNRIVRMYADFTDFSALSQTMPDDPKKIVRHFLDLKKIQLKMMQKFATNVLLHNHIRDWLLWPGWHSVFQCMNHVSDLCTSFVSQGFFSMRAYLL